MRDRFREIWEKKVKGRREKGRSGLRGRGRDSWWRKGASEQRWEMSGRYLGEMRGERVDDGEILKICCGPINFPSLVMKDLID